MDWVPKQQDIQHCNCFTAILAEHPFHFLWNKACIRSFSPTYEHCRLQYVIDFCMLMQPKLEWQYHKSSETLSQIGINSGDCSSNASVAGTVCNMEADALLQNWELNGGRLENDFSCSARGIQKHTRTLGCYVKLTKRSLCCV